MIDAFRDWDAVSAGDLTQRSSTSGTRCARAPSWKRAAPHPLAVQLLGRDLAIADVGGAVMAAVDRCPHRSTRLSIGLDRSATRSAARTTAGGTRPTGECVEIPVDPRRSAPGRAVPRDVRRRGRVRPRVGAARRLGRHDDPRATRRGTTTSMRVLDGRAVHVADLGAAPGRELRRPRALRLGARRHARPPRRTGSAGPGGRAASTASCASTTTRPTMAARARGAVRPLALPHADAVHGRHRVPPRHRRAPPPLDDRVAARRADRAARSGSSSRDDDLDGDDAPHLAFQQVILDEDEPVVCNQDPPELVLDPGFELSVRTDRVSIEYRRWLRELVDADGAESGCPASRAVSPSVVVVPRLRSHLMDYTEYLRRLPKVELHCHVEGTLRPQTVADLARQARHRAADHRRRPHLRLRDDLRVPRDLPARELDRDRRRTTSPASRTSRSRTA